MTPVRPELAAPRSRVKHSTTEPLRSLCIVERKAKHNSIHMIMGNYSMHLYESLKSMYNSKIISEYDQEIPQSQTADNPVAPRGRAAQPSRDTRKTN